MDKRQVPIPQTMIEAVRMFADEQVAHDFFVAMRWGDQVACPRACGSVNVVFMARSRRWYCRDCKGQFTAKWGTVFEDSPIGFNKWLPAFWLLASNRNGISSHELGRALKVTQRTAWFMLQRIRLAMSDDHFTDKLTGTIEADEAYIGGKGKSMNRKRRRAITKAGLTPNSAKVPVFGIMERKGRVRAFAVPNTRLKTLLPKLVQSIDEDATLYTDAASLYTHVNEFFLTHASVDHSALEYVRGEVHTNNIEAFWAVLKRTIGGTYTHVNPRHLDRYLAEQVFRFNEREERDGYRFTKVTKKAEGKRLTYKALTAK